MNQAKNLLVITLALSSLTFAQEDVQKFCRGDYFEEVNAVFLDCLDKDGHLIEQIAKYFSEELSQECFDENIDEISELLEITMPEEIFAMV